MIPAWVNKYVGLPFEDKGRGPDAYDCWGVTRAVLLEQFQIEMPAFDKHYQHHHSDDQIAALFNPEVLCHWRLQMEPSWETGKIGDAGDIIVMRFKGRPAHVGIVYEPGWFLHALLHMGVVRESYTSAKYATRVWGILRHDSRCVNE